MMNKWQEMYQAKLTTAADAADNLIPAEAKKEEAAAKG